MRCLQLPFHFDPTRLRADLALVDSKEWIPHVNRRHYDGEWSGAALRSLAGSATNLLPEAHGAEFGDTALLARCAYFREVLATFRCPLQSVRLLRLHAGSSIAEHVDHALDFDDGEIRLHVPIVTSDDVKFYLDGARLAMAPGECWYTNVNLPHSVENRGTTDRVHLVIDCQVNDWLRDLFASTPQPPRDNYAASLTLDGPPDPSALLDVFSKFAGERRAGGRPPSFQAERHTLILQWKEERAWQLRLVLPVRVCDASGWLARLESSPDRASRYRGEFEALRQRLRAALPGAAIEDLA